MKDDVKVKVPNVTPKTLIFSNGVVNWDGVLKFGGKPKGWPCNTFFRIERPIAHSLVWKCSQVDDTIKNGLLMWISSVMDGNR